MDVNANPSTRTATGANRTIAVFPRNIGNVVVRRTLCIAVLLSCAATVSARDIMDFDQGWHFTLGDPQGAEEPEFNDAAWRLLNVPHDWAFEAAYAEDAAQEDRGGYKPGGVGWYRKMFQLPNEWVGHRIAIDFDGVYMNSEVWINGHRLGKRPYGYIPFHYDLTPHLRPGKNVIAVRVDNSREPSAR